MLTAIVKEGLQRDEGAAIGRCRPARLFGVPLGNILEAPLQPTSFHLLLTVQLAFFLKMFC